MWRSLLSLLFHNCLIQAFPVFTFNGSSIVSSKTPSFASLVKDVDLPDNFILCSSVKHARFDGTGFYAVAGKDSRVWLKVRIQTFSDTSKLTIRWDDNFHIVGELHNARLDYWYHICVRPDLNENSIEVAVKGEQMGKVRGRKITNTPTKLAMTIGEEFGDKQFHGYVSNIQG